MNQKGTTKDESFLLKLCQMATAMGDPYQEVDRYAIGKAIGQNDKGIDAIVNLLAQTNFIKKGDGKAVYLTQHGMNLVEHLRTER